MTARRISSRRVVLTATFLALAAGGTAACDDPADGEWESAGSPNQVYEGGTYTSGESDSAEPDDYEESETVEDDAEVFYCADEDGEIVEEELCAEPDPSVRYLLWHSAGYDRTMTPGMILDGGTHFAANDRRSRRAFKLPATGRVPNGTIKTNVVGRASGGSQTDAGASSGG